MQTLKKVLPKGVRKKFETRIGKKVKIVNKLYCKNPKAKD